MLPSYGDRVQLAIIQKSFQWSRVTVSGMDWRSDGDMTQRWTTWFPSIFQGDVNVTIFKHGYIVTDILAVVLLFSIFRRVCDIKLVKPKKVNK